MRLTPARLDRMFDAILRGRGLTAAQFDAMFG